MKRSNFIISSSILLAALFATGCTSTKVEPEPTVQVDPVIEEVPEVIEEPVVEVPEDDEYERSTKNIEVSKDIWEEDKKAIVHIIENLEIIMQENDYNAWLTYIDQESMNYWSKKSNLQKAASRHPIKGIKFNNLRDYFMMVFIPSRKGRPAPEIRYDTETQIRAVVMNEDGTDTTYYNFQKVGGKWKVHLPENPE